jgi:hypothetical protein
MTPCPWHHQTYVPLRERFRPGMQFVCQGKQVTIFSVDFDRGTCIVRPHDNPVDLVVVALDELE